MINLDKDDLLSKSKDTLVDFILTQNEGISELKTRIKNLKSKVLDYDRIKCTRDIAIQQRKQIENRALSLEKEQSKFDLDKTFDLHCSFTHKIKDFKRLKTKVVIPVGTLDNPFNIYGVCTEVLKNKLHVFIYKVDFNLDDYLLGSVCMVSMNNVKIQRNIFGLKKLCKF